MKSILNLEQVAIILNSLGYSTVIDSDEYGASVLIKYNKELVHIIDYKELDGCHTVNDIENIAIEAVTRHEKPVSNEVSVEDLSDVFS